MASHNAAFVTEEDPQTETFSKLVELLLVLLQKLGQTFETSAQVYCVVFWLIRDILVYTHLQSSAQKVFSESEGGFWKVPRFTVFETTNHRWNFSHRKTCTAVHTVITPCTIETVTLPQTQLPLLIHNDTVYMM